MHSKNSNCSRMCPILIFLKKNTHGFSINTKMSAIFHLNVKQPLTLLVPSIQMGQLTIGRQVILGTQNSVLQEDRVAQ